MRILLIIITILAFSFSTKSFSFTHDKIIKDLNKAAEQLNKDLNSNNAKDNSKPLSTPSSSKKANTINPSETKKITQNNNFEALNQKISSTNQITLIYCKVSLEREWTQDYQYRKKKKGQIDKIESIIFDNNEDLKNCSDYKVKNEDRYYKQKVISSLPVSPKEYENYWVNRLIKSNNYSQFPFGQKVKIKLPTSKDNRHTIVETVLKKSDLVRYCMGGNSTDYNYRIDQKSVYSVSFQWDSRDKIVKSYCKRAGTGSWVDYDFLIVPVSNGKFSKDDVGYRFSSIVQIKAKLAAQDKAKKESELAEQQKLQKQREYANSPEGILKSSYQEYMLIKDFYEVRENYAVKYVNSQQFSNARKQIKEIESAITKKNGIKSDKVWNEASELYKKQWASTMEIYKSTGSYTQQASGIAKLALMSLSGTHSKLVQGGAQAPKKDF